MTPFRASFNVLGVTHTSSYSIGRFLLAVATFLTIASGPARAATIPAFCDTAFSCAAPGGAVYIPEASLFLSTEPNFEFVIGVEIDRTGTLLNPTPVDLLIADVVEGRVRDARLHDMSIDFTFDITSDPLGMFGETVFASVLFDVPIQPDFAAAFADDGPLVGAVGATLRFGGASGSAPIPTPVPAPAALLLSSLAAAVLLRRWRTGRSERALRERLT